MTEVVNRIEEHVVDGKRLGRHILHDPRSRKHEFDTRGIEITSVVHAAVGLPLNQGNLGSCTANALSGALNSQPDYQVGGKVLTETDAVDIYKVETKLEGQPYPPNDPGGSGVEVCKAGQKLGLVKSYQHTFSTKAALKALVVRPVIIGISWFTNFDTPPPDAVLTMPGKQDTIRGGHEILLDEIDADQEQAGAWNSWGTVYGAGGKFYIPFKVLEFLLSSEQQGDCTVPIV